MKKEGFRYHPMAEVDRRGWDAVMKDVIREAKEGPDYLYISFDIDSLDPAYTPGTGTPEPGGLTTREAFPIVRRLCAEVDVVGFELVELLPYRDPGYTTVLNANRIVRECLVGLALRKKGDHAGELSPSVDPWRKQRFLEEEATKISVRSTREQMSAGLAFELAKASVCIKM